MRGSACVPVFGSVVSNILIVVDDSLQLSGSWSALFNLLFVELVSLRLRINVGLLEVLQYGESGINSVTSLGLHHEQWCNLRTKFVLTASRRDGHGSEKRDNQQNPSLSHFCNEREQTSKSLRQVEGEGGREREIEGGGREQVDYLVEWVSEREYSFDEVVLFICLSDFRGVSWFDCRSWLSVSCFFCSTRKRKSPLRHFSHSTHN